MRNETSHSFTHEAMKTVFQLRLCSDDTGLARNAALDCFDRLDAIEASLSRYVPGSDVWQINHMEAGQSLFISEDCYACLRLAAQVSQASGGLFDVSLGRWIEHQKSTGAGEPPPLEGHLVIDETRPQIHCRESGREIDLGGIGKGYALDALAVLCREWGVRRGLVSAGSSTQVAFGEAPWPITLQGDRHSYQLQLQESALSASGTAIQGSHIVDPSDANTGYLRNRAWVHAKSGAIADGLSTAALLADDLKLLQQAEAGISMFTEETSGIQRV